MDKHLILKTSISTPLLRHTLFLGMLLASLGILGLILASVYIDLADMRRWGWLVFLICLGLITIGMLPYRRLVRVQMNPNELHLVDSNHLQYYSKGRSLLTLPFNSIAKVDYIDKKTLYGIAIWLKPPPNQPVIVHQCRKMVDALRQQGQRLAEADLFFPYFNQRAFQELVEWQKNEEDIQKKSLLKLFEDLLYLLFFR